jgi:serine/threonine protein phosphatase PrpC
VQFKLLDSLTLPGDPAKPNEDAFAHTPNMAVVFDGATGLGERLMPGASDAQWIAQFAVRRLRAYAQEGENGPREWLHDAAFDAATSFEALRRREPAEKYETPYGSLMLAGLGETSLDLAWFGDCAALLRNASGAFSMIGEAVEKRARESGRAAKASASPAAAGVRDEFLPALRAARNKVNTQGYDWLFAPDPACADHARAKTIAAAPGTTLLLASDGFLALAADYRRYTAEALLDAVIARGLAALGEELRAIEAGDPDGRAFPRFKRNDDATALLLSIGS